MNQILYMNNQKKKGAPLDKKVILRIVAILCIVLGISLIILASYRILTQKENNNQTEPLVEVMQEGENLKVKITHDKVIDKVTYRWNEEEEVILQGKGREQLEEIIPMPVGNNILELKVTDINKRTVSYSQMYERAEGDVINPEIELQVESSKVKIVAKDETELDYMIYYWNDEDETTVQAREDSLKQIEEKIDILKGENKLTIIAVDKAGNEAIKEQIFKGVKKPEINLSRNGNELVIRVTDEEGIQKIEYTLNGQFYSTDPQNTGNPLNLKDVQFTQMLAEGENSITIKAYSINGIETEVSGETTI